MQYRMKTHQLPQSEVHALLGRGLTGTLSTVDPDGAPYSVPVHFVFLDGAIYFHGLPAGQKLANLKTDPRVCFTVYEMRGLLLDPNEKPCDTNTVYVSVVIQGTAKLLDRQEERQRVLSALVTKYTPQLAGRELPSNMVKGTAVVQIAIEKMTGKYYQ
ncbi:MAG: pyridoxamine 5'-phosphate oxidase family protein [Lachnospiraceae bacterium]|nr:pyridoxamine 5'-phosphate oxidase family protein [Lachnospiraceae bacterium]